MKILMIIIAALLIGVSSCKTKKIPKKPVLVSQTEEILGVLEKVETTDSTKTEIIKNNFQTFSVRRREIPSDILFIVEGDKKVLKMLSIVRMHHFFILSILKNLENDSTIVETKFGKTVIDKNGKAIFKTAIQEIPRGSRSVYGLLDGDIWQTIWDFEMEDISSFDEAEDKIKRIIKKIQEEGPKGLKLE